VPTTNSAKQSAAKRTIFFGSARCVMPKTMEVKSENSKTALKCERFTTASSRWPPNAHRTAANDVQQSGHHDELCPIIRHRHQHGSLSQPSRRARRYSKPEPRSARKGPACRAVPLYWACKPCLRARFRWQTFPRSKPSAARREPTCQQHVSRPWNQASPPPAPTPETRYSRPRLRSLSCHPVASGILNFSRHPNPSIPAACQSA